MKKLKFICFILAAFLSLCIILTGCGNTDTPPKDTSHGTNDIEKEETTYAEKIAESTPEETTGPGSEETADPEDHPSLTIFRQGMIGTTQMFAAAYLGYTVDMVPVSYEDFLTFTNLTLYNDLPFIPSIPEERVLGGGMGEVYCIVPLDEKATVSVKSKSAGSSYEEIYSSENGAPIIIFCNSGDEYPDTQITITTSAGNSITWYPRLNSGGRLETESGTASSETLNDFTPYTQLLLNEYTEMKYGYWKLPTAMELVGTTWVCEELTETGNTYWYNIEFSTNTASIRWNNDGEEHEYIDAPWTLTIDGDIAVITFDLGGFAGEQRCSVLIGSDGNILYTCADLVFGDDDLCDSGMLSRVLDRTYG